MLQKLRFKFTLVITIIAGTILAVVLLSSLYTAFQTQRYVINNALEDGIHGDLSKMRGFGDTSSLSSSADYTRLPTMAMDVSSDGIVLATNDMATSADVDVVTEVVEEALSSDADRGTISSPSLSWRRAELANGYRIAVVDTSASNYLLKSQTIQDVLILVIAVVVLWGVAWALSLWLLKPVSHAWDQQRQFVADASHELKTPLAVIIANTEILLKDDSISQEAKRWVKSTADESAHMKNLVEELLELARTDEGATSGSGIMHMDDVDFSAQVESAALEFDAIAFEHGSTLEEDVQENIHVTGDAEWTQRLIKILIDNAIKYATVGTQVSVRLWRDGKKCHLTVNNHGDVISAEDLKHIFDRFYRSDEARTRQPGAGGFGLGLAIAKGIATAHKGTIEATSNAEDGTTFTVTLPVRS